MFVKFVLKASLWKVNTKDTCIGTKESDHLSVIVERAFIILHICDGMFVLEDANVKRRWCDEMMIVSVVAGVKNLQEGERLSW